jgi:hypothetical protein
MNNYNEELMKNIETRFKTTMIGSLAKFEEYFGDLWEEDNRNRLKYEKLWDQARNAILNNGNNQMRIALDELEDYFSMQSPKQLTFREKYRYKFYFNNNNDGDQSR